MPTVTNLLPLLPDVSQLPIPLAAGAAVPQAPEGSSGPDFAGLLDAALVPPTVTPLAENAAPAAILLQGALAAPFAIPTPDGDDAAEPGASGGRSLPVTGEKLPPVLPLDTAHVAQTAARAAPLSELPSNPAPRAERAVRVPRAVGNLPPVAAAAPVAQTAARAAPLPGLPGDLAPHAERAVRVPLAVGSLPLVAAQATMPADALPTASPMAAHGVEIPDAEESDAPNPDDSLGLEPDLQSAALPATSAPIVSAVAASSAVSATAPVEAAAIVPSTLARSPSARLAVRSENPAYPARGALAPPEAGDPRVKASSLAPLIGPSAGLTGATPDPAAQSSSASPAVPASGSEPQLQPSAVPTQTQATPPVAERSAEPRIAAAPIESAIAQVGELREALRSARPEMTLRHAEFGTVSLRLEAAAPDQWRAVLASRDPGFVPAIQAALAERAVAAAAASPDAGAFSGQPGGGQNGAGDHRYGSSPNPGQGGSQPYLGQSGSRDGEATPDHRRSSTAAALGGLSEGEEEVSTGRTIGGLFA